MTQSHRPVVLVIDPDALTLMGLSATLYHENLEIHGARTRTAALRAAQELALDLIVVDCWIEPDQGQNLIRSIRMLPHLVDVPVVFLTDKNNLESFTFPASSFEIQKPIDLDALVDVVKRAVWMPHLIHTHSAHHPHTFSSQPHATEAVKQSLNTSNAGNLS